MAFAGYFAVLSSAQLPNKYFLSFIVAFIGIVFTFAWYLVNRGSKYWQENWENHLDFLEDKITGPLYKTLLERPESKNLIEKLVTGPMSVSVSKVNQWVSVFVEFIWLSLAVYSAYKTFNTLNVIRKDWLLIGSHVLVLFIAVIICFMMIVRGKSNKEKSDPIVVERKTRIGN